MGPGAVAWECGLCLAEYLVHEAAVLQGKRYGFSDSLLKGRRCGCALPHACGDLGDLIQV